MIFDFNKATSSINELSRTALVWLFTKQNKSGKVRYQGNPSGGMYGQLVSRDTTHRP